MDLSTLRIGPIRCKLPLPTTIYHAHAIWSRPLTPTPLDNSPWTQVTLVGFLAFCSVGMHSALGYMGAGGLQDVQLSMITNAVLYSTFFVAGFFGGSINVSSCPSLIK